MTDSLALTLHFDINGTVTCIDNTDEGLSHAQLINLYLSKSCYGKVVPSAQRDGVASWKPAPWPKLVDLKWADEKKEETDDIYTHYQYLALTKQDKARAYTFLQDARFADEVTFKQAHATAAKLLAMYTEPDVSPIFPSFMRTLNAFPQAKVIMRTFGVDAPWICKVLREKLDCTRKFVGFRLRNVKSDGSLVELIETHDVNGAVLSTPQRIAVRGTPNDIGDFLDALDTDAFIVDDYQRWSKNQKAPHFGKPLFPVERSKRVDQGRLLQIGFDDNPCMHNYGDPSTQIVRINPLEPLLDENVFIKCIIAYLVQEEQANEP